jgi:hypothetical protein
MLEYPRIANDNADKITRVHVTWRPDSRRWGVLAVYFIRDADAHPDDWSDVNNYLASTHRTQRAAAQWARGFCAGLIVSRQVAGPLQLLVHERRSGRIRYEASFGNDPEGTKG